MKLYLNPEYEELRNDLLKIAEGKYAANKVFCHKRNVVEKVTIQGKEYVVKTYKRPNFFNRFAYTYLRKSKAERAYMHAKELLRLGIDTPCPVAYMEKKRKGLFNKGYYVSEYLPYRLMHDAYTELGEHDKEKLTKDFMDFTIEMHDKKILPLDFNSSNIFYHFDEEEGHYRFAITDTNRMRFGKRPSTSEIMRSFEQLGINVEWIYKPALYYCTQKGGDVEYSIFLFLLHRIKSRIQKGLKLKIKNRKPKDTV